MVFTPTVLTMIILVEVWTVDFYTTVLKLIIHVEVWVVGVYTHCTVPFSLFADPERILRRLYVFAEEPCKSTNTTSEPCSPVFKEAQPRPSDSLNLKYHINNLNLYLYVFGL